ncbi:MAG: MmcQ/YjbR family DNA-binding protein [Hyphomonadaceae bacterium]
MTTKRVTHPAARALRERALSYPKTVEDHPWGDTAFKVDGKKVFCFFGENEGGGFGCSMKLPFRAEEALTLKDAMATPYGLGRAGWVSMKFGPKAKVPLERLFDYLDESWRAVAPKKLSAAYPQPPAPKKRKAT